MHTGKRSARLLRAESESKRRRLDDEENRSALPRYDDSSDEERATGTVRLDDSSEGSDTGDGGEELSEEHNNSFICDDDDLSGDDSSSYYHATNLALLSKGKSTDSFSEYAKRMRDVGVDISLHEEGASDVSTDGESVQGPLDSSIVDAEREFLEENVDLFDPVGVVVTNDKGYPHTLVYDHTGNDYLTADGYINPDCMTMFQDEKINCVAGPMGIGKSTYDEARVQEVLSIDPPIPTVYITYSASLCETTSKKYGLDSYKRTDVEGRIRDKTLDRLVICINSLRRLKLNDWWQVFMVIILDEIAGILSTLYDSSLLLPSDAKEIRELLIKMINHRRSDGRLPTVKVNDALLGEAELYWLTEVVNPQKDRVVLTEFRPKQISRQLPRIVVMKDFSLWVCKLVECLTNAAKERVVLMTGQKRLAGNLVTLLTEIDPNIREILGIPEETWDRLSRISDDNLWLDGDTAEWFLQQVIEDVAALMRYNLFGFSPVISSGVSWAPPLEWDTGFLLSSTHLPAETLVQMTRRPRSIKNRVIYAHFTSKPLAVDFSLDPSSLSEMIKNFSKLTEKSRNELASASGLYMNIGRGPNRNAKRQQVINSFFACMRDDQSRMVSAYLLRKRLLFKTKVEEYFRHVMMQNDPSWEMVIDNTERTSKAAPLTRTAIYEVYDSTRRMHGNDLVQCANGPMICKDQEVLKQKIAYYHLSGKYSIEELSPKPSAVQRIPSQITAIYVERVANTFDPLGVIYELVACANAKESTALEVGSLSHHYIVARATVELFKCLGYPWDRHVKVLEITRQGREPLKLEWISLSFDEATIEQLELDTKAVVGQWTLIMDWCIKYKILLASNSISVFDCKTQEDRTYKSPPAPAVQMTIEVIRSWLGLFGIQTDKTRDYMLSTGRRQRIHASKLVSEIRILTRPGTHDLLYTGIPQSPPGKTSYTLQRYVIRLEPVYDSILQLLDMAHRLNLSRLYAGAFSSDKTQKLPLVVKNVRSHVMDDLSVKEFYDTPSFWLLMNPMEYNSKALLKKSTSVCFDLVKEAMTAGSASNDVFDAVLRFCGVNQRLQEAVTRR